MEDCRVEVCMSGEGYVWLMQPEAHTTTHGFLSVAQATFVVVIPKRHLPDVLDFHFDLPHDHYCVDVIIALKTLMIIC
jgi:hypothetical protein